MPENPTQRPILTLTTLSQREIFIRFSLTLFCLLFWFKGFIYYTFPILIAAWLLDTDRQKLKQLIREPLIQAILFLCFSLAIGLFWSNFSGDIRLKWIKYFALLIYIPFFSLLNKTRLPLAFISLITGYAGVVSLGIYQWLAENTQGIPLLNISYLGFSAMLGIGVIILVCLAGNVRTAVTQLLFWSMALLLLFVQFNQNGRGLLIATLIAVICVIFLQYKIEIKKYLLLMVMTILVSAAFAVSSDSFENRFALLIQDISKSRQGNYRTSVGYRLAMWDVGLNGISKRPFLGYGTGTPADYFEKTIPTYKNGIYKDLPEFQNTSHYHNDWIELGMHLGLLGICAFVFLLRNWYRTFNEHQLPILGAGLVMFIFCAGLTDTLMLYNRIPILLLIFTAMIVSWRKQMATPPN